MCVTRVARVLSVRGDRALVRFLDQDVTRDVDVSMVKVRKNSYVEVFAESVLSTLSSKEARWRRDLWLELWKKTDGMFSS